MRVNVTKRDIEQGRRSPTACPIALAIQRRLPKDAWVYVLPMRCEIHRAYVTRPRVVELPLRARQFIRDFDGGRPTKPVRFELKELAR